MRPLLILLLACLPLLGLTVWSFVEALAPIAPAAGSIAPPDLEESRNLAADATAQFAAAEPLARALERGDLLALNHRELPSESNERLKELAKAWEVSEQARSLARAAAAIVPRALDEDAPASARREHAENSLTKLREFASAEREGPAAQLTGADSLFKLLDARAKRLQGELARYRHEDSILAALEQASDELDAGRYDASLAILGSEPLAGLRDGETGQRVQLLRKRAAYRQAAERLLARQPSTEADRELFANTEAFLRSFSKAPSPAEAELSDRLMRKRDRLQLAIAIADLANPADLETLLAQAAAIVDRDQVEQATEERIRSHVISWLLNKGFPRLEPPADLIGKQEAVTKNDQRKIGIFFLPPGAEQWRFWNNRRDREQRPRGDEQIPRDSFQRPPATPMYVVWAQEYNDESVKLIKQGGGVKDWQEFARRCDERQQELAAYREKWGIDEEPDRSCLDWNFLDAAATARTIIERWPQFEQVLGKST